jgi:hypothetical protein
MDEYRHVFTGASSTRFIDGNIVLIAYSGDSLSFSLPMGTGTHYLPVTFTVRKDNNTIQTDYTLSLKDGAPAAQTLPATLDRVSTVRYFDITNDRPGTILTASLQLSYDSSDHVADRNRLRIAEDTGSTWVNLGGVGTGTLMGKITTTVNFTTFGHFVLADAVNAPVLPLNNSVTSGNVDLPDFYKLTTNGDGKLRLTLVATKSTGATLQLFDGDTTTSLGSIAVNGNTGGIITKNGLAQGAYFVKVTPNVTGLPCTYVLADSIFKPAEANNKEPDSTPALAHFIFVDSFTTGHIGYYYKNHRDTADWYKIFIAQSGTLRLKLTSANNNAISLTFYNSALTVLGTAIANGNSTKVFDKPVTKSSVYYVMVKCANSSQFSTYTLADSLLTTSLVATSPGDGAEEIKTPANYSPVKDAFVYPNPAQTLLHIRLNAGQQTSGYASLIIKDANGKTVWSNQKAPVSSLNNVVADVSKLPGGIYFLQIISAGKTITKKVIVSR